MAESTILTLSSGGSYGSVGNPSFSWWNAWNSNLVHNSMITSSGDEVRTAPKAEVAFDFTRMTARIVSSSSGSVTLTFRKGLADGSNTLSITSGQTGTFRDTSHTDSLATTDTYDVKGLTGASGSFRLASLSGVASVSGQVHSQLVGQGAYAASGSTTYFAFGGELVYTGSSTETDCKIRSIDGCTLSKLQVYVSSNNNTATVRTRKNGANGGQTISITSSATGFFEDASGSDTISSGDDFDGQLVCAGSITLQYAGVNCASSTSGRSVIVNAGANAGALTSTTTYTGVGGPTYEATGITEANTYLVAPTSFVVLGASVFVGTNSASSAVTHKFRKNAANSGPSISVTASTTGAFSDTTTTTVLTDDLINYQMIVGSGSIKFSSLTLLIQTGAIVYTTLATATLSGVAQAIAGGTLSGTLGALGNSSSGEVEITSGMTFTASAAYAGYAYGGLNSGGAGMRDGIYNVVGSPLLSVYGTTSSTNTYIQVDLGADTLVSSISLGPIANAHPHGWGPSYTNGRVLEYATSAAPSTWNTLVANVTGVNDAATTNFPFTPVTGRYFRLRAASGYTALGEFRIYASVTIGAGMTLNGKVTVSGDLNKTLSTLTKSMVGTVLDTGALSQTLGTLAISSAGTILDNAALSKSLGTLTLSGVATDPVSGTLSQSFSTITISGVATNPIVGTFTGTLGTLTISSAGTHPVTGDLSSTLSVASLSGVAQDPVEGSLTKSADAVTLSSAVADPVSGSTSVTLGELALDGAALDLISGTLSVTLDSVSLSTVIDIYTSIYLSQSLESVGVLALGGPTVSSSLDITLESISLSGAMDALVGGSLSRTLRELSLAASGEISLSIYLAATLDNLSVDSSSLLTVNGDLSKTLGSVTSTSDSIVSVIGDFSCTLGVLIGDLTASRLALADMSTTLEPAAVEGFADSSMEMIVNQTLDLVTSSSSSSSGEISLAGYLTISLTPLSLLGQTDAVVTGQLARTLGPLLYLGDTKAIISAYLSGALHSATLRSSMFDHRRRVISTILGLQSTRDRV